MAAASLPEDIPPSPPTPSPPVWYDTYADKDDPESDGSDKSFEVAFDSRTSFCLRGADDINSSDVSASALVEPTGWAADDDIDGLSAAVAQALALAVDDDLNSWKKMSDETISWKIDTGGHGYGGGVDGGGNDDFLSADDHSDSHLLLEQDVAPPHCTASLQRSILSAPVQAGKPDDNDDSYWTGSDETVGNEDDWQSAEERAREWDPESSSDCEFDSDEQEQQREYENNYFKKMLARLLGALRPYGICDSQDALSSLDQQERPHDQNMVAPNPQSIRGETQEVSVTLTKVCSDSQDDGETGKRREERERRVWVFKNGRRAPCVYHDRPPLRVSSNLVAALAATAHGYHTSRSTRGSMEQASAVDPGNFSCDVCNRPRRFKTIVSLIRHAETSSQRFAAKHRGYARALSFALEQCQKIGTSSAPAAGSDDADVSDGKPNADASQPSHEMEKEASKCGSTGQGDQSDKQQKERREKRHIVWPPVVVLESDCPAPLNERPSHFVFTPWLLKKLLEDMHEVAKQMKIVHEEGEGRRTAGVLIQFTADHNGYLEAVCLEERLRVMGGGREEDTVYENGRCEAVRLEEHSRLTAGKEGEDADWRNANMTNISGGDGKEEHSELPAGLSSREFNCVKEGEGEREEPSSEPMASESEQGGQPGQCDGASGGHAQKMGTDTVCSGGQLCSAGMSGKESPRAVGAVPASGTPPPDSHAGMSTTSVDLASTLPSSPSPSALSVAVASTLPSSPSPSALAIHVPETVTKPSTVSGASEGLRCLVSSGNPDSDNRVNAVHCSEATVASSTPSESSVMVTAGASDFALDASMSTVGNSSSGRESSADVQAASPCPDRHPCGVPGFVDTVMAAEVGDNPEKGPFVVPPSGSGSTSLPAGVNSDPLRSVETLESPHGGQSSITNAFGETNVRRDDCDDVLPRSATRSSTTSSHPKQHDTVQEDIPSSWILLPRSRISGYLAKVEDMEKYDPERMLVQGWHVVSLESVRSSSASSKKELEMLKSKLAEVETENHRMAEELMLLRGSANAVGLTLSEHEPDIGYLSIL
ncbi:hypothetical protein CBR_g30500 [Chara braunii]|uniref:Uncharacterized protein n=1 Tax=Chara braunii TaxID=69332 RepID=A0A388LD50_CHABU|nr:hypothetical protein CBR_g30500 [Chara braunii]|eukprot:GBG80132.1 hypothetical protein CBR_g30500 [Chara braunii]